MFCSVPIDTTAIKTLYVFVEIAIDSKHLEETVRLNFPNDRNVFQDELLSAEEERRQISAGSKIGASRHLRIEGLPENGSSNPVAVIKRSEPTRLALVSTIQFVAALQRLKEDLSAELESLNNKQDVSIKNPPSQPSRLWPGAYCPTIPRSKPLSPGEILGCTAPALHDVDALM